MSSSSGRQAPAGVLVTHPNRDKAVVQGTRATVILLLIVSALLMLLITIGGGSALQTPSIAVQILYVILYLLLAFFASRWNRGVLPVASALAVLLIIFALTAAPSWFNREASGFTQPSLDAGLLGLLTLLLVPVQILLVAFAMRGFGQGWNVEIERLDPSASGADYGGASPHPA
jgi:hypothetical protein